MWLVSGIAAFQPLGQWSQRNEMRLKDLLCLEMLFFSQS